ncbi:MAG: 5-formyltetrahydrofolate cyclo-ligase, partial [Spirochaetae bacterium HGW-Spirochaetae-7]
MARAGTEYDQELAAAKAAMRKAAMAKLAALSPALRSQSAARAASIVTGNEAYRGASLVLAFLSMPTEIDTRPVIEAAMADGKRVAVPRIDGADIAFVELTADWRDWPRDRWDIPAPPETIRKLSFDDIAGTPTLALVPGLAFDRTGGRLGRGKGYYDRFLSAIAGARAARGYG